MTTLVIGLTGGTGAGKSLIAEFLAARGAQIISLDRVGHALIAPGGEATQAVVGRFGEGFLAPAGGVDRPRMAELVFADKQALEDLNAIVHPLIKHQVEEQLKALRVQGQAPALVVEGALLDRIGLPPLCDHILVANAPASLRVERLVASGRMSREQAQRRVAAQPSDEEYAAQADTLIDAAQPLEVVEQQVNAFWRAVVGAT